MTAEIHLRQASKNLESADSDLIRSYTSCVVFDHVTIAGINPSKFEASKLFCLLWRNACGDRKLSNKSDFSSVITEKTSVPSTPIELVLTFQ
jgi:hypothetical protein